MVSQPGKTFYLRSFKCDLLFFVAAAAYIYVFVTQKLETENTANSKLQNLKPANGKLQIANSKT